MPGFTQQINEARPVAGPPDTLTRPNRALSTAVSGITSAAQAGVELVDRQKVKSIEGEIEGTVGELDKQLGLVSNPSIDGSFKDLEVLNSAKKQGRLNESAFLTRLDAKVRELKKNNPGFEDVIDTKTRSLLGQDPRIALRTMLFNQAEKEGENEQRVLNFMIGQGLAVLDDSLNVDEEATKLRFNKLQNLRFQEEILKSQAAAQSKGSGGSSGNTVREEMQPAMNEFFRIYATEFVERTSSRAKIIGKLRNPTPEQENELLFGTDTTPGVIQQLGDLRQEMVLRLAKSELNFAEKNEVMKSMDESFFQPFQDRLTNKDYGFIGRLARLNDKMSAQNIHLLYQMAPMVSALRDAFKDAYAARMVDNIQSDVLDTANREGLSWMRYLIQQGKGEDPSVDLLSRSEKDSIGKIHWKTANEAKDLVLDEGELKGFVTSMATFDDVKDRLFISPDGVQKFVNDFAIESVKQKLDAGARIAPAKSRKAGKAITAAIIQNYNTTASRGNLGPRKIGNAEIRYEIDPQTNKLVLQIGDGKKFVEVKQEDIGGVVTQTLGAEELPLVTKMRNAGLDDKTVNAIVVRVGNAGNAPQQSFINTSLSSDLNTLSRLNHLSAKLNDFKDYANESSGIPSFNQLSPNQITQFLAAGNALLRGGGISTEGVETTSLPSLGPGGGLSTVTPSKNTGSSQSLNTDIKVNETE